MLTEAAPARTRYLEAIFDHLRRLHDEQAEAMHTAARLIADHIKS
ncbi:MAG: sugar isomerase, partial [Chloroflexi bacterium]|nr:sugar isomerase [Chloroflexota bacterium]